MIDLRWYESLLIGSLVGLAPLFGLQTDEAWGVVDRLPLLPLEERRRLAMQVRSTARQRLVDLSRFFVGSASDASIAPELMRLVFEGLLAQLACLERGEIFTIETAPLVDRVISHAMPLLEQFVQGVQTAAQAGVPLDEQVLAQQAGSFADYELIWVGAA